MYSTAELRDFAESLGLRLRLNRDYMLKVQLRKVFCSSAAVGKFHVPSGIWDVVTMPAQQQGILVLLVVPPY